MRFDVFTIFPGILRAFVDESILKRAQERELVQIHSHDLRDWTTDRHRSIDDYPYGGGAGMVMMAPPLVHAVEHVLGDEQSDTEVLIMSPSGEAFNQTMAEELAHRTRVAIICGRYEGIDERVEHILNARAVSVGDYVLTGGELPAAIIIDAVSRLLPGVIDSESTSDESHSEGLLEYPHYTRPYEFRGLTPPDILLSGHHARVAEWRRQQAITKTLQRRPELLDSAELTDRDQNYIAQLKASTRKESGPNGGSS